MVPAPAMTRIRQLYHYLRRCNTREGKITVIEAMLLAPQYPNLSAPELLRLAYWGASGTKP